MVGDPSTKKKDSHQEAPAKSTDGSDEVRNNQLNQAQLVNLPPSITIHNHPTKSEQQPVDRCAPTGPRCPGSAPCLAIGKAWFHYELMMWLIAVDNGDYYSDSYNG